MVGGSADGRDQADDPDQAQQSKEPQGPQGSQQWNRRDRVDPVIPNVFPPIGRIGKSDHELADEDRWEDPEIEVWDGHDVLFIDKGQPDVGYGQGGHHDLPEDEVAIDPVMDHSPTANVPA